MTEIIGYMLEAFAVSFFGIVLFTFIVMMFFGAMSMIISFIKNL